jgi:hypothetical protein
MDLARASKSWHWPPVSISMFILQNVEVVKSLISPIKETGFKVPTRSNFMVQVYLTRPCIARDSVLRSWAVRSTIGTATHDLLEPDRRGGPCRASRASPARATVLCGVAGYSRGRTKRNEATMTSRARYTLIGVALIVAVGLIGWYFFGGLGDVLKPDGGPVVTVMDFGQSFPLDPLPSGWRHRKFWTRSPMSMAFAVEDGVPSMRFETQDSASMLFRHA